VSDAALNLKRSATVAALVQLLDACEAWMFSCPAQALLEGAQRTIDEPGARSRVETDQSVHSLRAADVGSRKQTAMNLDRAFDLAGLR